MARPQGVCGRKSLAHLRLAGIKPAPQGGGREPYGRAHALLCCAVLWGRVYPGRRRWERGPVRVPHSAGRHIAGPTGGGREPSGRANALLCAVLCCAVLCRPCENSSAPYREPCLAFPIRRRQVEAFLLDGE